MVILIEQNIELKEIVLSEAKNIFHTIDVQREYLGQWLEFVEKTLSVEDTIHYIQSVNQNAKNSLNRVFMIMKEKQFIGTISCKQDDPVSHKIEIGYWISKDFQKQGIVTKAVKKVCDFIFQHDIIDEIEIKCRIKNHASKKIPIRLGFKLSRVESIVDPLNQNNKKDFEVYHLLQ